MPAFDKPVFTFLESRNAAPEEGAIQTLIEIGRFSETIYIDPPCGFYKFANDVLGVKSLEELTLYVEKDKNRYYLSAGAGDDIMDLFYYTASTTPHWLDQSIKRSLK